MPRGVQKGTHRGKYKTQGRGSRGGKGWNWGIPDFHISNQFVYAIESLQSSVGKQTSNKQHGLAHAAVAAAQAETANLMSTEEGLTNIRTALSFLKQAADSERKKETALIREYAEKLKQMFGDNKDIDQAIQKIEAIQLDNPNSFVETPYLELTQMINYLRKGKEDYIRRLKQIQKHQGKTYNELYKDTMAFRGRSDLVALLKEAMGADTKYTVNHFSTRVGKAIREKLFSADFTPLFHKALNNEEVGGLLVSIGADILARVEEEFFASGKEDYIQMGNIEKIVDQYFNQLENNEAATRFQRALLEDSAELHYILDTAVKTFGIQDIDKIEKAENRIKAISNREKQIAYRKRRDKNDKTATMNLLKEANEDALLQIFRKLDIKADTKSAKGRNSTSHGNYAEFFEQFCRRAVMDQITQATHGQAVDNYAVLGSVSFQIPPEALQMYTQFVNPVIADIGNKVRGGVENSQVELIRQRNEAMQEVQNMLGRYLNETADMKEDDNIFIFHESMKMYKSFEIGEAKNFSGRTMNILNYIDEMYSMPADMAGMILPNKNNLYFLALNASDLAIGGTVAIKNALAAYFSLFAGLIMFDDLGNMAMGIKESIANQSIKNIHLYLLNGVYVPSSMILSYTYTTMASLLNLASSGKMGSRRASVQISTKGADTAINEVVSWTQNNDYSFLNSHNASYSQAWPWLANKVSSGTMIKIAFLSGFLKLIDKLEKLG